MLMNCFCPDKCLCLGLDGKTPQIRLLTILTLRLKKSFLYIFGEEYFFGVNIFQECIFFRGKYFLGVNIFREEYFSRVNIFQRWIFFRVKIFRGEFFSGLNIFQGQIFFRGKSFSELNIFRANIFQGWICLGWIFFRSELF